MWWKSSSILIAFVLISISGNFSLAACPSADLYGDCFVDFEDFAVMANLWSVEYDYNDLAVMAAQWMTEGIPEDPNVMAWVYIDDPGVSGHEGFTGYMSKYETTNAQYCEFLNAALASGDIIVGEDNKVYGAEGSNSGEDFAGELYFITSEAGTGSQIIYSDDIFSVVNRDSNDMIDHPVVEVSWYGATAFCNYYVYRLPTVWEWRAVADYDGSYKYGCGTSIDQNLANYWDNGHANPLNLSSKPYTSPVGYYPCYGYGMCDMAGNVWELTSSCNSSDCFDGSYIFLGGAWNYYDYCCLISDRYSFLPDSTSYCHGFRVCR
ncbi:MAG: formylglycine-generating enzyme family protein [Planctomycetota bacterium]|jgi:formylglycine-generating enzyme required for sulfatase activity